MDSLTSLVDRQRFRPLQMCFPHDEGPEQAIFADYAETNVEFRMADSRGSVKVKEAHWFFGKRDCPMTSIRHVTRKDRKPEGLAIFTADKIQCSATAYELFRRV